MIIATYHSEHPELAENRRWLAQIEKIKGRYYVCFHGSTEAECISKAETFMAGEKPKKAEPEPAAEETPKRRDIEDLA